MNIHNKYRTIYFARVVDIYSHVSNQFLTKCYPLQSGQSLIEHSYRADSDLSPSGWEYAETLKNFILDRRRKNIEHRKALGLPHDENNKLVVSTHFVILWIVTHL